jgi:hypothetical protein
VADQYNGGPDRRVLSGLEVGGGWWCGDRLRQTARLSVI